MMRRRVKSGALRDLEANAAVVKLLLGNGKVLIVRFPFGHLDGVDLHEAVQMAEIAPPALIGVAADGPRHSVDDSGVLPTRQLHEQSSGLAAVELGSPVDRFTQIQPLAGSRYGRGIA
jgi:hypothetical protein